MNNDFLVKITLPSKTALTMNAQMVTIPGKTGVFSVLKGHVKLVTNIRIGIISIFADNIETKYFIYGGIAQVDHEELNILSEFAVNIADHNKTVIMDKIDMLQNKLHDTEAGSLDAEIVADKLQKYESLLKFI